MNALRLLLLLFLFPLSVAYAAVPVPLTGKLVPGSGPGAVLAVDGNFAAESSGSSNYGANTSAGSLVLLRDRTLFDEIARVPVESNTGSSTTALRVLRYLGPMDSPPAPLTLEMVGLGRTISEDPR